MSLSKKLSFSAILSALAVIIMLLGSFIETVTLATAAVASVCVMIAVIELGKAYALLVYAVSSALAILLLPVKDPALFYALSFGFYPIIKLIIERISIKPVCYLLKGAVFSASFFILFFIAVKVLVPESDLMKYLVFIFPAALAVFFAFDFAFSRLIRSYAFNLRKRLRIDKLLK